MLQHSLDDDPEALAMELGKRLARETHLTEAGVDHVEQEKSEPTVVHREGTI